MNTPSLFSFLDLSSLILIFFLIPIALVIFWLLIRELLTWYWKVNKIISTLEEISSNLKILTADKKIEQLGQTIETPQAIPSDNLNKITK